MNKKIFLLLLISVFIIGLSTNVLAQSVFDDVLGALAGDRFDIKETYDKYGGFIDFFIYVIIFVGISQFALVKHFKGPGGKAVIIGVAIALSLGAAYWGSANNFRLIKLGVLAVGIVTIILIYALYKCLSFIYHPDIGFSRKIYGIATSVVLVWFLLQGADSKLTAALTDLPKIGRLINALISVLLVIAIIGVVTLIAGAFKGATRTLDTAASKAVRPLKSMGRALPKTRKAIKERAAEKSVEKGEIKKERGMKKTLSDLEKRFGNLIKGKKTANSWERIKKDTLKLSDELKKLEGLEKEEASLEQLKGISENGAKLIQAEAGFLKNFEVLIGAIFEEAEKNTPASLTNARLYSKDAKKILNQLIKINRKQKR